MFCVSYKRRSSIKENNRFNKFVRGPNGGRLCRFCKTEVSPPRRTFCSDQCVHCWKLRSDVKYLRKHVYDRDLGICRNCGIDTRQLQIELENLRNRTKNELSKFWYAHPDWKEFLETNHITQKESFKSLWQADHILEVADGGGESDLSNFQTLCVSCHKEKTTIMREMRAKKIRESRSTK